MKKGLLLIAAIIFIAFNSNAQTISEIQGTGDASTYVDQVVTTTGVITAIKTATDGTKLSYFIQDGGGARNGIMVYDNTQTTIEVGDNVTLTGTVAEYYDLTEIKSVTSLTINSSGNTVVVTTITATQAQSEDYEGVLVKVVNLNCTAVVDDHGIWTANDGTGDLKGDDLLYRFEPVVGTVYDVTGCMDYSFSERKICPRDVDDVPVHSSINSISSLTNLYPNPASSVLNIKSEANISNITVSNVIGQRVLSVNSINSNNYKLNVENLNNGVYLININNVDGTSAVTKFVKK